MSLTATVEAIPQQPAETRKLLLVIWAATVGAYVMYTLDAHTVAFFGTDRLVWSAPFPPLAIARFLVRGIASRSPAARRTLSVISRQPAKGTAR